MAKDHVERAEQRLDEVASPEHPRRYADSDEPTSDAADLHEEQEREGGELRGVPAVPFMTGPQRKGLVFGTIIGAVIGGLLFAPLAFIPMADLSFVAKLAIVVIVGAVAGSTAGASYWGGRASELSGESLDADNRPPVGSSMRDPHTDERGR